MKKTPIDIKGLTDALGGKRIVVAGEHPRAGDEGVITHFEKEKMFNAARAVCKMDDGTILHLDQNYLALKLKMKIAWYQKVELWLTAMFAKGMRLFRLIK